MSVAEVVWPGPLPAGADWLFVRGRDTAVPEGTVDALLGAAEEGDALLAALVVDGAGAPRADRLPAGREADTAAAIAAVAGRRLPIRNAPFAAVLLRSAVLAEHGVPDAGRYGAHAPVVWTARVLAAHPGFLVPAAVVVEERPARQAGLSATLRAARSGTWTRGEQVRAIGAALRRPR